MSNFFPSEIQRIKQILVPTQNIIITSHHNPDGDAIGSVLGLYYILKELGLEAEMILPNDVPDFLAWLPGANGIIKYSKQKEEAKRLLANADIIFSLDYNGSSRLEKLSDDFARAKGIKILIDHHPFPSDEFNYTLSDTNVSSTAELVFEFAIALKGQQLITPDAAMCIYTGIMTDTGSFSYGCSNPRTFEIVAQLVKMGIDIETAQQNVYNTFSEGRMKLLGYALANKMKVYPKHRAAYISLTKKELKQFGYRIGDTEGLVNYPLSIKNIVFSALFIENTNHVKVSLRSRGNFPANLISEKVFNGGGHKNAAGGKSFTTLAETEEIFIKIIEEYSDQLNA
ncbi:MAG: bifunctional oligoribonuclease/PAP phosphatase NrnA [Tenuifilaceae bacterium]|jgi:phosphoesterase RecJ-like protein|nr:bifunctional oligoribonuclease/PAP phosphatase NrnA [Tenuifilaceae bacterium]